MLYNFKYVHLRYFVWSSFISLCMQSEFTFKCICAYYTNKWACGYVCVHIYTHTDLTLKLRIFHYQTRNIFFLLTDFSNIYFSEFIWMQFLSNGILIITVPKAIAYAVKSHSNLGIKELNTVFDKLCTIVCWGSLTFIRIYFFLKKHNKLSSSIHFSNTSLSNKCYL